MKTYIVNDIGNTYGGLYLMQNDGKYYWQIIDYTEDDWIEIPENVFMAILPLTEENN